mmetsp:Transcript_94762/g.295193  ORF Transcript_94762/g.295193 Transcript_94762/m.295193 type:complete len:414 (+) Transcript_94762:113-1354(+)
MSPNRTPAEAGPPCSSTAGLPGRSMCSSRAPHPHKLRHLRLRHVAPRRPQLADDPERELPHRDVAILAADDLLVPPPWALAFQAAAAHELGAVGVSWRKLERHLVETATPLCLLAPPPAAEEVQRLGRCRGVCPAAGAARPPGPRRWGGVTSRLGKGAAAHKEVAADGGGVDLRPPLNVLLRRVLMELVGEVGPVGHELLRSGLVSAAARPLPAAPSAASRLLGAPVRSAPVAEPALRAVRARSDTRRSASGRGPGVCPAALGAELTAAAEEEAAGRWRAAANLPGTFAAARVAGATWAGGCSRGRARDTPAFTTPGALAAALRAGTLQAAGGLWGRGRMQGAPAFTTLGTLAAALSAGAARAAGGCGRRCAWEPPAFTALGTLVAALSAAAARAAGECSRGCAWDGPIFVSP